MDAEWFGLIIFVVAPFAALVYRHPEKWNTFYDFIWPALLIVCAASAAFAFGALFDRLLSKHDIDIVAGAFVVSGSSFAMVLAIQFAHWLREP